jgi:CheY-like chemotaxis protein
MALWTRLTLRFIARRLRAGIASSTLSFSAMRDVPLSASRSEPLVEGSTVTILVVDDDPGVRHLLRRMIDRDFRVTVIEASGGTQALDILLRQEIDFVLMDVVMPVIDGLETLRLIRRSPKLEALPVVMLTGMPDENNVREAIGLKVVEFVAKPVSPATFRDRIATKIDAVVQAKMPPPPPSDHLLDLAASRRVVIVDRNAECRTAAMSVLGRLCHAEPFDNEFGALSRCLDEPPDVIVVGLTSDLSSREEFVGKLRGHVNLKKMRIIGAVTAEGLASARASGLYHHVVERALSAADFERQLVSHVTPETRARLLIHGSSSWAGKHLLEAVAHELGNIACEAVTVRKDRTVPMALRWIASTVELRCGSTSWTVRYECPFPTALNLARLAYHGDADEVTEAMALNAIASAVRQIGQRVQDAADIDELRFQPQAGSTSVHGAPVATLELGPTAASWRFAGQSDADLGAVSIVRN